MRLWTMKKLVKAVFSVQGDTRHGATSYDPDNNRCPGVPAAGFYRAPLQNSYLKTVVAEKIIKFLYSFSQKAFHGEYQ